MLAASVHSSVQLLSSPQGAQAARFVLQAVAVRGLSLGISSGRISSARFHSGPNQRFSGTDFKNYKEKEYIDPNRWSKYERGTDFSAKDFRRSWDSKSQRHRGKSLIRQELVVVKNGFYQWWQQVKELYGYISALSGFPYAGPGRDIPGSPVRDPFPALMTSRDSRRISVLLKDGALGAAAVLGTTAIQGGTLALLAANRWFPKVLPKTFAGSRVAFRDATSFGESPGWRWWASFPDYSYQYGATPSASQVETNPLVKQALASRFAGALTNEQVVARLKDNEVLAAAWDIATNTSNFRQEEDTLLNQVLERYDASSLSSGRRLPSFRLSVVMEMLPWLVNGMVQFPVVPTKYLREALDFNAVAPPPAITAGFNMDSVRHALSSFWDKVQVDDAHLRRERASASGLFGLLPTSEALITFPNNRLRDEELEKVPYDECIPKRPNGTPHFLGLGTQPPMPRTLGELRFVADQRYLSKAASFRDARAALNALHQWLDASQHLPVGVLYAASKEGATSAPVKH